MNPFSEDPHRHTLANRLVLACAFIVAVFWSIELRQTMVEHDRRGEEILVEHQHRTLTEKAEQLNDIFNDLYSTSRTISLLPMIRTANGPNRRSASEDMVAAGILSRDTHRSLQQIYINLHSRIKISEIYFVLDGFDPAKGEVPFLMYDDSISHALADKDAASPADAELADESFEYAHIPLQLDWFRQNAPKFEFSGRLERIPVRLSPWLLTCDDSQVAKNQAANPRDIEGMVYAMPVYAMDSGELSGMITTILRRNVIEAKLLGVPFIPVTPSDHERMRTEGWSMPEIGSTFLLRNQEYGLDVHDRRHPLFEQGIAHALKTSEGRWASVALDLHTGAEWTLYHHLEPSEAAQLLAGVSAAKRSTLIGRIVLLLLLGALLYWGAWLLRRSRQELMRMAHYDALTELPNRRSFFERLEATTSRAQRNRTRVGLFFVDIAGFNAINDSHGQQAGDILLAAVAERLVDSVRSSDLVTRKSSFRPAIDWVSRLGGDEFTIICDDMKSVDDLLPVAERILESIKKPVRIGNEEIEISLYVGIACYPDDAQNGEKLLMAAENAMQECRSIGPGFRMFNEEMRRRAARQHELMVELQGALERRQFELFYQPKALLATDDIISLEALLRWNHPVLGMISPAEFIPLLERSGRIVEVGEWVLMQSCRDLQYLDGIGMGTLRISANVSVRQLRRGNFHETLCRVFEQVPVQPDRLILEITESMVMENLSEGRETLEKLKALGARLAIDDFGTGYSSLTYLQFLPLDYLKLDKSFIDGMTNDRARHIVQSVILLARGLELQTIAEGIETVAQKEELASLGCDMIQGYLLSKPRPLPELITWIKARPIG